MDFLWSGVLVLNDFFRTFVRRGRAKTSKEMDGTLKIDHDQLERAQNPLNLY